MLFNLLVPVGWRIGLVRVEDVAIGGAVSLASACCSGPAEPALDLGRALAGAYREASGYLADAVAYGVGRCDAGGAAGAAAAGEQAVQAGRVGPPPRRHLPRLPDRAGREAGDAAPRSRASSTASPACGSPPTRCSTCGTATAARAETAPRPAANCSPRPSQLVDWYDRFAGSLTGGAEVPDPLAPDPGADGRLVDAVAHDLRDHDGHATATGVRIIWTGDHLDAVRRLQQTLVEPARAALAGRGAVPAPAR